MEHLGFSLFSFFLVYCLYSQLGLCHFLTFNKTKQQKKLSLSNRRGSKVFKWQAQTKEIK